MKKKYLWCDKCKKFPDKIIERYLKPIEETRIFDKSIGEYGLDESNIDDVEFEQLCGTCRSKLVNKNE